MAFEIAYFTGGRGEELGVEIASESVAIGADSTLSGETPTNAMVVVISATAPARYAYGADRTAHATSQYLIAELERRLVAVPGATFSVRDFDALPALSLDNDEIAEDEATGTLVGNIVGATAGSTVTLQAQSDADMFAKDANRIEVGSAGLDFEGEPAPTITLREVLAGYTTRDTIITITVTDIDDTAPQITSAATANCAENAQLAHLLEADEVVTWAITGGVDAAQFAIDDQTLTWVADGVQDFETPLDTGGNNTYVVEVTATDTNDNDSTPQSITITVTDVGE